MSVFGKCPKCGNDDVDVGFGPDDGITWIVLYSFYCFKCHKRWIDCKL